MAAIPSALEACKVDLLLPDDELRAKYPLPLADRISRLRDMYNYWLANPDIKDCDLRKRYMGIYGIAQSTAYADINVLHELVPLLSRRSREYHRARYNEMILNTYRMAKDKEDIKTMERAATSYGRFNGVDREEEMQLPYDQVPVQPFCASTDVTLLGVKPIPNVYVKIDQLSKELSRDFADINDVEFEEVDLEEDRLFKPIADDTASKS